VKSRVAARGLLAPYAAWARGEKSAFSVPIRNCHLACFVQVGILLLVFSVRLEFIRSKIELRGFGLCSLRGVCAMQNPFCGEDKLTLETVPGQFGLLYPAARIIGFSL